MKAGAPDHDKLDTIIRSGCSLTAEFAAGGRETGVQFPAPRLHFLIFHTYCIIFDWYT